MVKIAFFDFPKKAQSAILYKKKLSFRFNIKSFEIFTDVFKGLSKFLPKKNIFQVKPTLKTVLLGGNQVKKSVNLKKSS